MERRQLEYFVAISRTGSLAAAAELLHVTQPALSQSLRQLEKELGCELFHRLPRGMRLTPAGEALLDPAKQIFRDFATARASVDAVLGLEGGTFEIASLPGIMLDPLAEWISAFRRLAPKVQIRVRLTEVPEDIPKAVRTGDVELGLMLDIGPQQDLIVKQVGQQEIVAVFPPGSTLDPDEKVTGKELLEHGMILGGPGVGRELIRRESERTGKQHQSIIEVNRRDSVLSLVLAGAGAGVLPRALATLAEASGAVVRSLDPPAKRGIYVLHRNGPPPPALRLFEQILTTAE
ncbi:LysR substrate-binding domain-containing protein [Kocuria kalidii]|uniref:LysR family transcriptional regulator n=1 Tax=Kocuria kalidii TaxID=3376283 RepID=UPI0037A53E91